MNHDQGLRDEPPDKSIIPFSMLDAQQSKKSNTTTKAGDQNVQTERESKKDPPRSFAA